MVQCCLEQSRAPETGSLAIECPAKLPGDAVWMSVGGYQVLLRGIEIVWEEFVVLVHVNGNHQTV